MNYIWELVIRAKKSGINLNAITYKFDDDVSPYMELSFADINESGILSTVNINPYYRYYEIFKNLLNSDLLLDDEEFKQLLNNDEFIRSHFDDDELERLRDENGHLLDTEKIRSLKHRDIKSDYPEIVNTVLDITTHHLAQIDIHMGMNKREFHINFLINDMKRGYLGSYIQKNISVLTVDELVIVANNLLNLYATGEEIHLLRDSVRRIFRGAYVFSNTEEQFEIVFFLRTVKTEAKEEKMALIKYLFLPFKYSYEIYWDKMFGVIESPELMVMGDIVQY